MNELFKNYSSLINKKIDELYPDEDNAYSLVRKAARYSLLLGGKRVRPVIMLEFCKMCGGDINDALDFAVALEMIHTYSLIHDDLPCMDDDDLRRGNPSCHKKFGEDIALLAGDALLTEAFRIASNAPIADELKVKSISVLAENSGDKGMIGGQMLDLSFEKSSPDTEMLTDMYLRKTGGLIINAAVIGCICSGKATENQIDAAIEYAKNLSLAFQIIDDILDYTADEELLGKPIGSDQKNNKTTFVTLHGLEKAKEIATELSEKAKKSLDIFEEKNTNLVNITNILLDRKF